MQKGKAKPLEKNGEPRDKPMYIGKLGLLSWVFEAIFYASTTAL